MKGTAFPFVLAAFLAAGAPLSGSAAQPKERPLPETAKLDLAWWRGFNDPQLDSLLAEALAGNLDVKTAAARLGIAEAGVGAIRAERRPSLNLDGGLGVRKYSRTASHQDPDINRPALELSAGYEVDLWGRLAQRQQAQIADWRASAEDVTSAQLALSAEVAAAWFALRANAELLNVLAERLEQAKSLLALQQTRARAGLATGDETLGQAEFIANLDLERSSLVEDRARLEHRLSALRGLSAADAKPLTAPPLGNLEGLALPRDLGTGLLAQRPDVRAATLRLRAQQARVGVAHAATLPALTLLGKGFFTGDTLREFLRGGSLEGFLAAQISVPLLDGGRNRARLDAARAELTLAGEEYSAVVVRAFEESANAVSEAEEAQSRLAIANQMLTARTNAAAFYAQRKAAGLIDRLASLNEQDRLFAAQQETVRARLDLLKAQIDLGLALALGAPPEA